MKIPVPDKPEPDSYLKFPVPVMQNGMKIRKIRYPVPVSKSTFRSSPTCEANFRLPLVKKGPAGSDHGPKLSIFLDRSQDNGQT